MLDCGPSVSRASLEASAASVAALWDRRLVDDAAAAAELAAAIQARMDGIPFAPDALPTPLRPVVLSASARAGIAAGAQRLASLLVATAQRRCVDPAALAEATGHPADDLLLMPREWSRWAHTMLRPDVVVCRGRPQFLEANFHSHLGGLQAVAALAEVQLGRTLAVPADRIGPAPNPFDARRALLEEIVHAHAGRPALRVVVTGYDHEHDFQTSHYEAEVEHLVANGASATLARPREIEFDGTLFYAAEDEFDCCLRFFLSDEAVLEGADVGALQRAAESQAAPVLSDDHCSLYGDKTVLAWLSEDAERGGGDDAEFVQEHIPWTRVVADVSSRRRDEQVQLLDYLERNRERLVLKPAHGRGSYGIVFGHASDAATWRSTIEHYVRADPRGVVQEYVTPDAFPVALLGDAGSVSCETLPVVFGVYLMGQRVAGLLARVATEAHDGAIYYGGPAGAVYTTAVSAL